MAPGAKEARVYTVVLGTGWVLTTTMLVNVTLPVLLTLPEKVSNWPGATGVTGHVLVTTIPAVKVSEQVLVMELVTVLGWVVNWSTASTVNVTVLGLQGLNGIQLPLNGATWPARMLVMNATWV